MTSIVYTIYLYSSYILTITIKTTINTNTILITLHFRYGCSVQNISMTTPVVVPPVDGTPVVATIPTVTTDVGAPAGADPVAIAVFNTNRDKQVFALNEEIEQLKLKNKVISDKYSELEMKILKKNC